MRDSIQTMDYKSEFRDLSDAVQRLLPFALLDEPDLSDKVLDQCKF